MTNLSKLNRKTGGFSLIEVLIAVLVLATGMLALAALQSALIRNSVDAKNRSQAMSIAVDTIERVRQNTGANITDYENLPVGQTAWTAWAPPAGVAGAGANYSADYESRRSVTRYVRESNQAVCGGEDVTPCFRVAGAADAPQEGVAEFKRIDIEVRWTDPQDNVRTVSTSDIVGSVTDDKTSVILDQTGKPSTGVGEPVSRIPMPSEIGIIPIGIGGDEETAASNPKPVTGRERGRTDETQFQVLTYGKENAGTVARLERVIDTRVIGCRCNLQGADGFVSDANVLLTPVQATFWDGIAYTEPEDVANRKEKERGRPVLGASQSVLCQTCCLDHHDRASNAVRLDPWRTEELPEHKHYFDPIEGDGANLYEEAAVGQDYLEVCRMVRVNGLFRVATDMRLDVMNLLETDPNRSDSLPLESQKDAYAQAVKDYIGARFVSGNPSPGLAAFDSVGGISPLAIRKNAYRYLHNRGLYVDHLEEPAEQALADALANCPATSNATDCALRVLPFVSINTTEIGQWRSQYVDTDVLLNKLNVTNFGLAPVICQPNGTCSAEAPAARGVVYAIADGDEDAVVSMRRSNSGVSDSNPIDPQDAADSPYTDQSFADPQGFAISGGCETDSLGGFSVKLLPKKTNQVDGIDASTVKDFYWLNPLADPAACAGERAGTCSPNQQGTFECATTFVLPQDVNVFVRGYNLATPIVVNKNPCTNARQDTTVGYVCHDWDVSSVLVGGQPVNPLPGASDYVDPGKLKLSDAEPGEGVTLRIPQNKMAAGATIQVGFTANGGAHRTTGYNLSCPGGQVVVKLCTDPP